MQVVRKDLHTEILQKRTETLRKRSYSILIEMVEKDLETESLRKWSYRILIEVVHKGLDTGILRQRYCTSCPTNPDASGPPETGILHKCYYRILIQVVQKDPDTEILLHMSCGFNFASRRCTLTHTVWGLLPG